MGEADGVETGRGDADVFESEFNLFCAESGVDEQAGIGGGDIDGVSGASAGEYTEFKLHRFRFSLKTGIIVKLGAG